MKTYGGVDVYIHIFLLLVLDGGEVSDSLFGRFSTGVGALCTHWAGARMSLRAGVDIVEKRKTPCFFRESNSHSTNQIYVTKAQGQRFIIEIWSSSFLRLNKGVMLKVSLQPPCWGSRATLWVLSLLTTCQWSVTDIMSLWMSRGDEIHRFQQNEMCPKLSKRYRFETCRHT
jgi:hypothetical protein